MNERPRLNQELPNDLDGRLSAEIQSLVNRLCDQAAAELKSNRSPDWDVVFRELDSKYWKTFLVSLLPRLQNALGVKEESQLLPLFSDCQPQILALIDQIIEATTTEDGKRLATADGEPEISLSSAASSHHRLPETIDNFSIIRSIGQGGFGEALLARDNQLHRDVVLKIPRRELFGRQATVDSFVQEARKIAALDHPAIVKIYHVGTWLEQPYLVQQYISGGDLKQLMETRQLSFRETAGLIADIADGISFAHKKRIVHRDLKPANILIDGNGRPLITDFGLAIHESEQLNAAGTVVGTLKYMAPEQIRGESHRLDGRTDLWAIGVCMYRMLVGELPFSAETGEGLREQISRQQPRPPRQINPDIPRELERICLKCLSKRMSHRFDTATDLARETRDWQVNMAKTLVATSNGLATPGSGTPGSGTPGSGTPGSGLAPRQDDSKGNDSRKDKTEIGSASSKAIEVVPRGLSAFERGDHDFFVRLIPGPRNRDGVPEQIYFWIDRVWPSSYSPEEITGPFGVGLIYGPSGCGKSSFVKAGLLPLLPEEVICVYVEATDSDTENRIASGLRKHFPGIPVDLELPRIFSGLRSGHWMWPGQKLLLIIDQFEQWLHANKIQVQSTLIQALRHCDGFRVQTIVMARDDFWMKVSRFFEELEITLSEHENFHPLYLFDADHAKKVLTAFGWAYGRFREAEPLTVDQNRFIEEAVKSLTDNDKIVCIHLVLLAETLKYKPWTSESLKQIGNLKQVGKLFLEQHFSDHGGNPVHRLYRDGICKILRFMLPVRGTDIKARFCDRQQLADACGEASDSKTFNSIMNILQSQLRLIAAADPDTGVSMDAATDPGDARHYQLTHDFLVPAVREWLEQIERGSASGRARLRLETLSHEFADTKDRRFLPNLFEFLSIALHVRPGECSTTARTVYWRSFRRHGGRIIACAAVIAFGVGIWRYQESKNRNAIADARVKQWLAASPGQLTIAADLLRADADLAANIMSRIEQPNNLSPDRQLRIDLGLSLLDQANPDRIKRLVEAASSIPIEELAQFRPALQKHAAEAVPLLLSQVAASTNMQTTIHSALMLFHLGHPETLIECLDYESDAQRSLLVTHAIIEDTDVVDPYLAYIRESIDRPQSHDLLSAMVKAIGRKMATKPDADRPSDWGTICEQLYLESPSGPMHSAAEFALRSLGRPPDDSSSAGPNWTVTPNGLTLVRIPADGKVLSKRTFSARYLTNPLEDTILRDYWMATTEVPARLFQQFATDPVSSKYFEKAWKAPEDDRPATGIRIIEAMAFCNWLSAKEDLTPYYIETDQPFQLSEAEFETFDNDNMRKIWQQYRSWSIDRSSNGYRLPDFAELAFAPYGAVSPGLANESHARRMINEYAWYSDSIPGSDGQLLPAAGKMPNVYGLFDILGSASEAAIDSRADSVRLEQCIANNDLTSTLPDLIRIEYLPYYFWNNSHMIGFRVVRSTIR